MDRNDAIIFAGKCEDWLDLPACVCEVIENKLCDGEYEEVLAFMVSRIKELA